MLGAGTACMFAIPIEISTYMYHTYMQSRSHARQFYSYCRVLTDMPTAVYWHDSIYSDEMPLTGDQSHG